MRGERMVRKDKPTRSKLYDATFKHLVEARPADALERVGIVRFDSVKSVDADLATVMPEADKVLEVMDGGRRYIVHLEFQTGHDRQLVGRLLSYNALLYRRHGCPVWTVLVLLAPDADHHELDGALRICLPNGDVCHQFNYQVVRVWQLAVAEVLAGGVGTLPLAPLCDEARQDLPGVVDKMKERLDREPDRSVRNLAWTATYFLMGLRYDRDRAARLIQGVRGMAESVTYLATLEEGAIAELRKVLLRMGRKRFGEPTPEIAERLTSIDNIVKLERLSERLLDVSTWEELLPKPARGRNGKRRKS